MRAIDHLPHVLYRFYDARGRLLYIGIAVDFLIRWRKHRKKIWWSLVVRMEIEHHPTRAAAFAAERQAIILEKPLHNRTHNAAVWGDQAPTLRERWSAWSDALQLDPWPRVTAGIRAVRLIFLASQIATAWFASAVLAPYLGLGAGLAIFGGWMLLIARMAAGLIGGYGRGWILFPRQGTRPSRDWRWRMLRAVLFVR